MDINSVKIKRIEALVEKIADCHYQHMDEAVISELNQLIGVERSVETYFEYCYEYWSHCSLEEVVWALTHDEGFPHREEVEVAFWKINDTIRLSEEEIYDCFRFGRRMLTVSFENVSKEDREKVIQYICERELSVFYPQG